MLQIGFWLAAVWSSVVVLALCRATAVRERAWVKASSHTAEAVFGDPQDQRQS